MVFGQHQVGGGDGFDFIRHAFQIDSRNRGLQLVVARPGVNTVADTGGAGYRAFGHGDRNALVNFTTPAAGAS